jgi:hypothetical protein
VLLAGGVVVLVEVELVVVVDVVVEVLDVVGDPLSLTA